MLTLIGSVCHGPVQDKYCNGEQAGPFATVKQFNDWLELASIPGLPLEQRPALPYRNYLPDDRPIVFTHGDLTRTNIMISKDKLGRVTIAAIIDWEQAGWYPSYWEYCKLFIGESYMDDWRASGWADRLMDADEKAFVAVAEYWAWRIQG